MELLESALLAEFIGYIKSNWLAHSREDQRRLLLRQLVSKVVEKTVEELERLVAGPGGDPDVFARVLGLDAARPAATAGTEDDDMDVDGSSAAGGTEDDMDVDGRPAPGAPRHRQEEGSGRSCGSATGSVAAVLLSPGAKRKRECGGRGGEVDTVQPQKRRLLAWTRPHQRVPAGSRRVSSARRRPPAAALPRSRPRPDGTTVALAFSRIRDGIKNPTTTTSHHRRKPSLGQHFARIAL